MLEKETVNSLCIMERQGYSVFWKGGPLIVEEAVQR